MHKSHTLLQRLGTLMIVGLLAGCASDRHAGQRQNLFPRNTDGWRSYRQTSFPAKGWVLEDGVLHLLPKSGGGDIVTIREYTNFELDWDWRIAPGGNNGVKYLVTEARPNAPGLEYQMVDDAVISEPKHQTAAFYDVIPAWPGKPLHPPGQWNHSRLIVQGNHVEHWLNGKLVLAYELGSAQVKAAVAQSKFKNASGFGEKITGRIMLTDHNGETWYREVWIRALPPK